MKVNNKYSIVLPEHRKSQYKQSWEEARLDSMHAHIKKGDVVYYAGAEVGEMPALCQLWGAKVVNIEPNHLAWPTIKWIWDNNNLEKPLYNFAGFASDETNLEPKNPNRELRQTLYKGKGWENIDGWPRYSQGELEEEHGFSELYLERDGLPQVRIDDIPLLFDVPIPDVIVFDVEGAEWEVMRGAFVILEKYKPKLFASIHPEFMYHQYRHYSRNFRDWLISFGYKETLLDWQHEGHFYYESK